MDECEDYSQFGENMRFAMARCRPKVEADNRGVAEGEVGYLNQPTGLPVGLQ